MFRFPKLRIPNHIKEVLVDIAPQLSERNEHDTHPTPSPWLGTARVAAAVIVAWGVAVQAFAGAINPPILVVTAVFALLIPLLRIARRWVGVVTTVLGFAAIAGNWGPLVDELSNPSSALGFSLTLTAATAGLVLMIAGVGVFIGWERQPRPVLRSWVAVVAVGTLFAFAMAAGVPSVPAADGDVIVTTKANQFRPEEIVVAGGQEAVWIDNRDGVRHTFTVPDLGIDVEVVGLRSQRVEIPASPGTYTVFCTVPGHEGMIATLVVE